MKKLFAYLFVVSAYLSICLFLPSPSFAIPGSLIYDINTPDVNNQQAADPICNEALSSCNSIYKTCQQQISKRDTINKMLTNNLSQEKKKASTLELILGVIVLSSVSVITIIFLRKKPSLPISASH